MLWVTLCFLAGPSIRVSCATDNSQPRKSTSKNSRKSAKRKANQKSQRNKQGEMLAANGLTFTTPKSNLSLDERLLSLLSQQGIHQLDAGPKSGPAKVELGRALFFDKELSGNRDTACATCHHPSHGTGDGMALSVGTSPLRENELGLQRILGINRSFAPRNAPAIFNLGSEAWTTQYWDGRIEEKDGRFISPASHALPQDFPNVVAVQAMFPVTSRVEMRGDIGDVDIEGSHNELADIADTDFSGIWDAIAARLAAIPEYQELFAAAFPGEKLSFRNACIAIAAFEADAYTFLDSPWDRYVAGDRRALSSNEKKGALVFFSSGGCSNCHSGALLTDQKFYNLGIPQFGPGKGAEAPFDHGRGRESGIQSDYFRFRTPPLRNCEVTGPYMHNGAYETLEEAVEHHVYPSYYLKRYEVKDYVDQKLVRDSYLNESREFVDKSIDLPALPTKLSKQEISRVVDFLETLTAPRIHERMRATIPERVPSGLPVDGTNF